MKFSIGDKVYLKRTGEEGQVVSIINKQMIEVEVGGTSFPVYADDCDHPYLKWFTEKPELLKKKSNIPLEIPQEKPKDKLPRLAKGVYLSFIPVFKTVEMEEMVDFLKVHLINETPTAIKFYYDVKLVNDSIFSHEGTIHEFGNIYLNNVSYIDMGQQPRFVWKLVDTLNKSNETAEGTIRIKPAKLFEHIDKVMMDGAPSFSYMLIEEFQKKSPTIASGAPPPPLQPTPLVVTKKNLEPAKQVIDLHIEQLSSNWKNMSNAEIIKKQLDTLDHYIHLAVAHRQDRMTVIHGLGKGRLREEVHEKLKTYPEVKRFKNEWSGKYGFGATEVHFKY